MPETFWEHVYNLRERGLIPRVWKAAQLSEFLEQPEGPYSPGTVRTDPYNYSISIDGDKIGYFVNGGEASKAWRVGRGQFRLVADPEDDVPTQEAERKRANERAEELRSQKRRENDHQDKAPMSGTGRPERLTPEADAVPGSLGLYPSIPVALTLEERQTLAGRIAEDKALYIVQKHLHNKHGGQAIIEEDRDGADLRVSLDGETERIEVKGTEEPTIAWSELEVSNQMSHDALMNGDISLYRVVDVGGASPRIYFLEHGRHFTLESEPKWAVKRVPPKDDPYPLRGEPYRYDRPFDPVAEDEWEAVG